MCEVSSFGPALWSPTERPKDNLHAIINNLNFAGVMWCLAIGTIVVWRRRMRDAAVSA